MEWVRLYRWFGLTGSQQIISHDPYLAGARAIVPELRTPGLHCTWHAGPRFVALVEGSSLQLPTYLGYSIGANTRLVRAVTDKCGTVHIPSLPWRNCLVSNFCGVFGLYSIGCYSWPCPLLKPRRDVRCANIQEWFGRNTTTGRFASKPTT